MMACTIENSIVQILLKVDFSLAWSFFERWLFEAFGKGRFVEFTNSEGFIFS